jgi:hypothetical protein
MNRPDTDAQDQLSKSSFSACNARPVHTDGPEAEVKQDGNRAAGLFDFALRLRGVPPSVEVPVGSPVNHRRRTPFVGAGY